MLGTPRIFLQRRQFAGGALAMILAGHLVRELLATLFVVTAVLLSVSVGARLLDYVGEVAQGGFAASALWPLLALRVPLTLTIIPAPTVSLVDSSIRIRLPVARWSA